MNVLLAGVGLAGCSVCTRVSSFFCYRYIFLRHIFKYLPEKGFTRQKDRKNRNKNVWTIKQNQNVVPSIFAPTFKLLTDPDSGHIVAFSRPG